MLTRALKEQSDLTHVINGVSSTFAEGYQTEIESILFSKHYQHKVKYIPYVSTPVVGEKQTKAFEALCRLKKVYFSLALSNTYVSKKYVNDIDFIRKKLMEAYTVIYNNIDALNDQHMNLVINVILNIACK
jgi:hypothetical protein